MIATCTPVSGVPTAPMWVSWCSGRNRVEHGAISVCPNSRAKSQPNLSRQRRISASGIGAIAYTARFRLDRSRPSKEGWSSAARNIIGSPNTCVIRSRSIRSSQARGSKPRMT